MKKTNKRRGFTLIEIIIVVIIIGILAALIVPKFVDATSKAKLNTALAEHRALVGAVATYQAENAAGDMPTKAQLQSIYNGNIQYSELVESSGKISAIKTGLPTITAPDTAKGYKAGSVTVNGATYTHMLETTF